MWEASSGTIVGDSSTVKFFTPNVESEVTVSCSISDSSMIYDTESTQISVTVPGFVGNYVLKTLTACDSTVTMDTDAPRLIWEIYDTHTSGKGFAYSWKVVRLGIPAPDSCHLQMPVEHTMGLWENGGAGVVRTRTVSFSSHTRFNLGTLRE